jgi:hypothetical protein
LVAPAALVAGFLLASALCSFGALKMGADLARARTCSGMLPTAGLFRWSFSLVAVLSI